MAFDKHGFEVPAQFFAVQEELGAMLRKDMGNVPLSVFEATANVQASTGYGTSVGLMQKNGELVEELAVKVLAAEESVKHRLQDVVPKTIQNLPVVIETVGIFRFLGYQQKYRPIPCGSSVGDSNSSGTLGCLVTKPGVDGELMLSNNHVFAAINEHPIGTTIYQPGAVDAPASPGNAIGALHSYEPISFTSPNKVDAALGSIDTPGTVSNAHHSFRLQNPTVTPKCSMLVKKDGRTTGTTDGIIRDLNVDIPVFMDDFNSAEFVGQILIVSTGSNDFSAPGDSGSLIVTQEDHHPVGLLFAGVQHVTLANPIDTVIQTLGLSGIV